jgi:hypothetical protein
MFPLRYQARHKKKSKALFVSVTWKVDYIASVFDNQATQAITAVTMVPSAENDILRRAPSRNGKCSTKNIYRHLSRQELIQLSQHGSRSITHHANLILQKAWRSKDLPPLIKTFTWRLIRRALATGERAARYSVHIDEHCSVCGAVEDDAYLFFYCQLPRVVWFSIDPPMRADQLPQEQDGVQLILQSVLPASTHNDLFNKILITLWYLARLGMITDSTGKHGLHGRFIMQCKHICPATDWLHRTKHTPLHALKRTPFQAMITPHFPRKLPPQL